MPDLYVVVAALAGFVAAIVGAFWRGARAGKDQAAAQAAAKQEETRHAADAAARAAERDGAVERLHDGRF